MDTTPIITKEQASLTIVQSVIPSSKPSIESDHAPPSGATDGWIIVVSKKKTHKSHKPPAYTSKQKGVIIANAGSSMPPYPHDCSPVSALSPACVDTTVDLACPAVDFATDPPCVHSNLGPFLQHL